MPVRPARAVLTSGRLAVAVALGLGISLAGASLGCGGQFADAVKRGDQYAQAGLWDQAAAEYDAADRIEPGNPEVVIKRRQIRQRRSAERLARGNSLLARGEIEPGLAVLREAVQLDPGSADAQRALSDANLQVLQKAEQLLVTPHARAAHELTQLVLRGSPDDPRARRMDDQVRDTLAGQAYARAEQFLESGKKANALIEYAAATLYRPGFRDAKVQIGGIKQALHDEIVFHVVLDRFATGGTAGEQDIAQRLRPELVGQAFDDRLALRVVGQAPDRSARGVHLRGTLSAYRYGPVRTSSRNDECRYVRGYDTVPNPERASAERRVSDAEQRLAQAERDVDQHQRDVDRYLNEVDDKQKDVDRAQAELEKARADYEKCQSRAQEAAALTPGGTRSNASAVAAACSSDRSRVESAQNSLQSRRGYLQSSRGWLQMARERTQRANDSRSRARHDVEDGRRRMRDIPATVKQPHYERENYPVEIRSVDAALILQLHAQSLIDRVTVLDNESFPLLLPPVVDDGWLARPATCPQQGKRLVLPAEDAMRAELIKRAIATLREKVQSMYESYRTKFLADARRYEASGVPDEAVESYVRFLLTGTRNPDPKDDKQIAEFLHRTRGFGKIELLGSL